MSQSRARKPPAMGGDACPRPRASAPKDSGDAVNSHEPHHNQRSKSRNKIPKSVRYNLENALVGLCNVWFEDIKPHLLRNNIKVHVHGNEAFGGCGEAGPPQVEGLPLGSPGCSHADPGAASDYHQRRAASCADCCTTPPTASSARSHRPRVSRRPSLSPLPSQPQSPRNRCPNCEVKHPLIRHTRRYSRPLAHQPSYAHLDNIYSVPFTTVPLSTSQSARPIPSQIPSASSTDNVKLKRRAKRKLRMKHKSTQTDPPQPPPPPSPSLRCQRPNQPPWSSSKSALRLSRSPYECRRQTETPSRTGRSSTLFRDDLIDIIGERHDQIIKVLYQSPRQEEYPSIINLARSPKRYKKRAKVPWRYN